MPSSRPKIHLPLPVNGIRADLDDLHIPPDALRSNSYNWLLRDGKIVTRPGLTTFGQDTGSFSPLKMISFNDASGAFHLIHATGERWWRYNTSTQQWEDISDAALLWDGSTSPVDFRVFHTGGSTYLLGTHGLDTPRAWDTSSVSNQFTLFGGSAPAARHLAIIGDRVLLAYLGTSGGTTVDVSAFQDHTTGWGVTQTAVLVETPGTIQSVLELGINQVAIYKTSSIYIASASTGIAPLRFDVHTSDISGPFGANAVVPLRSPVHAILTQEGECYLFDGITYQRHPSSDQVRTLFQQTGLNPRVHGHYNRKQNELWWFFSRLADEATGPQEAIVINMGNGSVWKMDFHGNTNFSFTTSYFGSILTTPTVFLGRHTGQFYTFEGNTDGGNPLDVHMETGLNDLGEPTQDKTIVESEHYFLNPSTPQTPKVAITRSGFGSDLLTTEPQSLTLDGVGANLTGHRNLNGSRVTTRFVGLQITDDNLTAPLEYRGSSLTIVPRGHRGPNPLG